jgi:hypothetical protein
MARRLVVAFLLVALAAPTVPALLVHMPPLLDYPDHFARLWLIAGGAELEPVSRMYAVDWTATWTNIGIDLAAAALGPLLSAEALAPLLLATAVALPPLGAVALNRAVFGTWHAWQVGFAFFGFAATLLAGFLNFQIGLGLALLAAAADPLAARRFGPWGLFLSRVAVAAALLVVHIFAVPFYAALIGALALGPRLGALAPGAPGSARRFGRALAGGLAAATPIILLYALAPAAPGAHVEEAASGAPEWGTWRWKLSILLMPVWAYHFGVDLLLAAALALPVAAALALGRLRFHGGLLLSAVALCALGLASPVNFAGTLAVDTRFPIMAALTLAAALRPEYGGAPGKVRGTEAAVAAGLLALALVRTAWVGGIWEARSRTDTAAVERALEHVPAGAAVLPMAHLPTRADRKAAPIGRYGTFGSTYDTLPALTVPRRRAYGVLFAQRGKHTLRVLPPWDEIHADDMSLVSVHALLRPAEALPRDAALVRLWRERFDYVLVVNADLPDAAGTLPPVPGLEPVANEGFARLYRIHRRSADGVDQGAHGRRMPFGSGGGTSASLASEGKSSAATIGRDAL